MSIGTRLYGLLEGIRIAFDAIRTNKVRAGLTILGIAVGVFVVTAMSAAVHGINEGVSQSIAAAGPSTFFLTKWPAEINSCSGSEDSCPWRHNAPLTVAQANEIRRLPIIQEVTAHIGSGTPIKYVDRELPSVSVEGNSPGWLQVNGGDIIAGRDFTDAENEAGSPVVVVNPKVVEKLFLGEDPVGKTVRLGGEQFTVIGVYQPIVNAFDSGNRGRTYVPFNTAYRRLKIGIAWMDVTVKPRPGVDRDEAMDQVITVMRSVRHLRPAQANDFFVSTPEKLMQLYNQIVGAFFLVMITLSAVGLLVGGVGVVAIMMISVTERTREIGVRKALGATRATILWQFLVEAATLTTVGAVIGLGVGGLLTWAVRTWTPIAASTPPLAIVAALVSSALAGITFGLLPAVRAAKLDPVEALRYE